MHVHTEAHWSVSILKNKRIEFQFLILFSFLMADTFGGVGFNKNTGRRVDQISVCGPFITCNNKSIAKA